MEKEISNEIFITLTPREKAIVIQVLEDCRVRYIQSNIAVDVPYFFWSINRPIFEGVDPSDFLDIKEPDQFGIQAVYYISKYIIRNRKDNNV